MIIIDLEELIQMEVTQIETRLSVDQSYSRSTSTKSLSFCMITFGTNLTT